MRGRPPKKINYENSTKLCPTCKEWKPFAEFNKSPGRPAGGPYCKSCEIERQLTIQHDKRSADEIIAMVALDLKMLTWRKNYLKTKFGINTLTQEETL